MKSAGCKNQPSEIRKSSIPLLRSNELPQCVPHTEETVLSLHMDAPTKGVHTFSFIFHSRHEAQCAWCQLSRVGMCPAAIQFPLYLSSFEKSSKLKLLNEARQIWIHAVCPMVLWNQAQQEVRQHWFINGWQLVYIQVLYRVGRVHRTGLTVSRSVDSSPQSSHILYL